MRENMYKRLFLFHKYVVLELRYNAYVEVHIIYNKGTIIYALYNFYYMKKTIKIMINSSRTEKFIPIIEELEAEGFLLPNGMVEYDDDDNERVKRFNEIIDKLPK